MCLSAGAIINYFVKFRWLSKLVISVGFAFCTIVIMKQMNFLHHSGELGFSFHNRASMIVIDRPGTELLANQLRQMPEIVEVVEMNATSPFNLIPEFISRIQVSSWDDKPIDAENIEIWNSHITPEIIDFYNFQLIAGEMLTNASPASMVLLNESAVRLFGWYDPVGRRFDNFTVKGVIRNVHNNAPTIPVRPIFYSRYIPPPVLSSPADSEFMFIISLQRSIMFKYHEGMWESARDKIRELVETEHPVVARHLMLYNTEEEVNKLFKSENALIRLLLFVSIICILICIFGFVSLVSLTCEERRKEIAIRKVHGALVGDILAMFAKEYFLLLIIGTAIAFTAGFFIMHRWLEHYVIRTNIPAWIYLSIVSALALVIVLCVGWQVYKSSVENPADVVKSE